MAFQAAAGGGDPYANPNGDLSVSPVVGDGVQDLAWSPTSNALAAASWDGQVRVWQVQKQGTQLLAAPQAQISHDGPVLCVAFSGDGSAVFSGSCDKTAKMWLLNGPAQGQQIAAHDAPIRGIAALPEVNCVATGSWDKTLKYWDTRSPAALATLQLPERVYAMDARHPLLVVATADQQIHAVDVRKPSEIYSSIKSKLKFQTRTVACFPDGSGFAVGSIEGRCAIQHVEPSAQSKDYTFRAHRDKDDIYPVNSFAFHPFGTCATAGGDGTFSFWDLGGRKRLKSFLSCQQSISVGKFNAQGDIYAYAVSYDWSMGSEKFNQSQPSVIRLHNVMETEVKPKSS